MREQYAFWSAIGITGVIALFWVVSLQYQLGDAMLPEDIVQEDQRGAFAQFLGEARTRAAAVFGAFNANEETAATTTDDVSATTAEQRPAFEFVTGPRAASSTDAAASARREVRVEPASATSSASNEE